MLELLERLHIADKSSLSNTVIFQKRKELHIDLNDVVKNYDDKCEEEEREKEESGGAGII